MLTEARCLRVITDHCNQQTLPCSSKNAGGRSADMHRATVPIPAYMNTRKATNFLITDTLFIKGVGTNICRIERLPILQNKAIRSQKN